MTDIRFICPHCDQKLSAAEDMEGADITCPSCDKTLTVPIRVMVPEYESPESVSNSGFRESGGACPYCREQMTPADTVTVCPGCETPHHMDCWNENSGCTIFGCSEAPPEEETISVEAEAIAATSARRPGSGQSGTSLSSAIPSPPSHPKTNAPGATSSLAWGIVGLFFCGLILGIVAIVNANKAKNWRDLHRERFGDHPALVNALQRKREAMVEQLKAEDLFSDAVVRAMSAIPMELFCPADQVANVYGDKPVFIGFNETISQPSLTASMLTFLAVGRGDKVLELKTASGYQTALLAHMGAEVYSLETDHALGQVQSPTLTRLGFDNLHYVVGGDAYAGLPQQGPYDKIIATAAYPTTPWALFRQLKPGGHLIAPVGDQPGEQYLMAYAKTMEGEIKDFTLLSVSFGLMPQGNTARSP